MPMTKDIINEALSGVAHPDGGDLVSRGCVLNTAVCDSDVSIRICYTQGHPDQSQPDRSVLSNMGKFAEQLVRAASKDQGVEGLGLVIDFVDHAGQVILKLKSDTKTSGDSNPKVSTPPQNSAASGVPGVKHIIAVGAGKGGVGKSTVAVNLAIGLARNGHSVGVLDGDIYGPSLPTMLGLGAMDQTVVDSVLQPFFVHGVKSITMGKLVETDKPLIWRGPMAHGAFHQLIERTQWGELDYLIIDLPPGTGDVPLTLAQSVQLTGAVIVCTPQKVAQDDAVRAAKMFESLGVEALGVVENMSYFIGDDGKEYDIFGKGGAQQMAQKLGLPFLGSIPINTALRQNMDNGNPTKNFEAATAGGPQLPAALEQLANQLVAQVTLSAMSSGSKAPTLSIS
ncbi:MAG: Mrp/NBP35 family ATP-binding protein [Phycisphaerales bacterium]